MRSRHHIFISKLGPGAGGGGRRRPRAGPRLPQCQCTVTRDHQAVALILSSSIVYRHGGTLNTSMHLQLETSSGNLTWNPSPIIANYVS